MPYDPSLPAAGSPLQSQVIRDQFHGIKDLIDAVPTITAAQVDVVNTVGAGQSAAVSTSIAANVLHLSFDIPQGPQGPSGDVTNSAMATAIATAIEDTSAVTNAVATLATPFTNDPPTLADIEVLRAKINEMLTAMRR